MPQDHSALSVDQLQQTLAAGTFSYATDRKKAAGRALGTLVEIIAYHSLVSWNLRDYIAIERSVPEYANPDIAHNVEFSLHHLRTKQTISITNFSLPITTKKLSPQLRVPVSATRKSGQILSTDGTKRNSALLAESPDTLMVANAESLDATEQQITVSYLRSMPFAIVECKRVGVEEGQRKGPQTIEKAKQGAYVANAVSALQRIRLRNGEIQGVIENLDGSLRVEPYEYLKRALVEEHSSRRPVGFIVTIGIVSNHGNWFTSNSHNKELRVLAQSYDWLIFLTDVGLSQFINDVILNPDPSLLPAHQAFLESYPRQGRKNRFTKVIMDAHADQALRTYFTERRDAVDDWYNVISPKDGNLSGLREELTVLAGK